MNLTGIKIVRSDCEIDLPVVDDALRKWGATLVLLNEGVTEARFTAEVADCDLLLACYAPVTEHVLHHAKRLRGIVKYGVGIDAIAIDAARKFGIPVVNIPEYAEETVAEGAFALILGLAKRFKPLFHALDKDGWVWPNPQLLGHDLAGKTIGLVGLGKIGSKVARMAKYGFRMDVLAFDPGVGAAAMEVHGVEKCDTLEALLHRSDFVSLHCVLNASTRGLIGANELSSMKRSAFLVNVSRGALVDETALVAALEQGTIAGCGLDVFSQEPLNRTQHPLKALYAMENVLLSPHLTFYTHEAMQRLQGETLERCREILLRLPVLVKSSDPRLRDQPNTWMPQGVATTAGDSLPM